MHLTSYIHMTAAIAYLILVFNALVFFLIITSTSFLETIPYITVVLVLSSQPSLQRLSQFIVPSFKELCMKTVQLEQLCELRFPETMHFTSQKLLS